MSNEEIEQLLESLNNHQHQNNIFLKSISSKVDLGFVWTEVTELNYRIFDDPKKRDKAYYPIKTYFRTYSPIYFIKDVEGEVGQYVAAVFDMKHDLHSFVMESFRKQGHLTRALKEVILPHLFLSRKEQRSSIDGSQLEEVDAINSEKVTLKVGFKRIEGLENAKVKEYLLLKKQVQKFVEFPNHHTISKERLEILRERLQFLTTSMDMLRCEFEAGIGKSAKLDALKVKLTPDNLEDLWWEFRNKRSNWVSNNI